MNLTIQLFEEYGPIVNGRGTIAEVTNINWKNTDSFGTPYHLSPIRRPSDKGDLALSYTKYNFIKITGTAEKIRRAKLTFSAGGGVSNQASNSALYYKMTNTYAPPNKNFDGSMIYVGTDTSIENGEILLPLSTGGPNVYNPYQTEFNGTVELYSPYIVTQLRVKPSDKTEPKDIMADVGNTVGFKINFSFYEY